MESPKASIKLARQGKGGEESLQHLALINPLNSSGGGPSALGENTRAYSQSKKGNDGRRSGQEGANLAPAPTLKIDVETHLSEPLLRNGRQTSKAPKDPIRPIRKFSIDSGNRVRLATSLVNGAAPSPRIQIKVTNGFWESEEGHLEIGVIRGIHGAFSTRSYCTKNIVTSSSVGGVDGNRPPLG